MSVISKRVQAIKPSPTLAITTQASEMKKAGLDIISLSAGEPDFDTPDNIKAFAIKAINDGKTKYTPVNGIPELRSAIVKKFKTENNIDTDINRVIVSTGGKQVIFNAFTATLNDGDEVIIPAPYWVSYPDMVIINGGIPVIVDCSEANGFKLSANELEQAITPKTKWLIINSPNNPSGAVYSKEELEALAAVLRKYPNVFVLSDDIYEHILYDTKFYTMAAVAPDLQDRIFTINGVSKSYSMTGWRIGYGTGPEVLIKAMTKVQSQSTSNPCSISQMAALEAIHGTQEFMEPNKLGFKRKRDLTISMLHEIKDVKVRKPEGAFYLLASCDKFFGKKTKDGKVINNSADFVQYLLEEAKVAVVHGSAFGIEGYFRISYATSEALLANAVTRIKAACEKLQ